MPTNHGKDLHSNVVDVSPMSDIDSLTINVAKVDVTYA